MIPLAAAGAILAALAFAIPLRETSQVLKFTVTTPADSGIQAITAKLGHTKSNTVVQLTEVPAPVDRNATQWSAEWTVQGPTLIMPIEILARHRGDEAFTRAGRCMEVLSTGRNELNWSVEDGVARRLSYPGSIEDARDHERRIVAGKMYMLVAVLFIVFVVAGTTRHENAAAKLRAEITTAGGIGNAGIDLLFWLILSIAWTWPAVSAGPNRVVGLHFDALATSWLIDAAPRIIPGLHDALASWPLGADYQHLDSMTLLPLAALLRNVNPFLLHGWFQVTGIALSAWAAQGFARAVGAHRPLDLIGGLAFAFSGLSAQALLEGYVYHVMNPWLPLCAWAWWIALSPRGRLSHGVLAGLMMAMTMLTSAYLGAAAMIVLGVFLISHVVAERRFPWQPLVGLAIVLLPLFALCLSWYLQGPPLRRDMTLESMKMASAHLVSLAGATPEVDRAAHSLAIEISPLVLASLVMAPLLLKARRHAALTSAAALSLLLACGPVLAISLHRPLFRTPLSLLIGTPFDAILRFPMRLAWAWTLCGGALTALVATHVAKRRRYGASLLLALAIILPFAGIRLPFRQKVRTWTFPTAYSTPDGPILDVFPSQGDTKHFDEMWFSSLACVYQVEHGDPIADNAIETDTSKTPRVRLGRWLTRELLEGRAQGATQALAEMGFVAIALDRGLFEEDVFARLQLALHSINGNTNSPIDHTACVVVETIPCLSPPPTKEERAERYGSLDSDLSGQAVNTLPGTKSSTQNMSCDQAVVAGWSVYLLAAMAIHVFFRFKQNNARRNAAE